MHDLFYLVGHNFQLNGRASQTNGHCLLRMRRKFGRYTVQACTGLVTGQYMAARQQAGCKPATINQEIAVLRVAFRLGNLHALLTRMPVIKRLPELGLNSEFFVRDETVLF